MRCCVPEVLVPPEECWIASSDPVTRAEADHMSGFDLVPVDGGAPVHLPPGETVLGRGPLLGVSDQRVSRRHGLLQNLSGQLQIKPMHVNPCFIQSSLTDDPRPLRRGSWFPLQDGDLLSLLPGQFIYKVLAVGAGEHTPRNSQTFEEEKKEEEERPTSPEPDVEPPRPIRLGRGQTPPHEEPTSAALSNEEEEEEEEGPRRLHQEDFTLPKEEEDDRCAVPVMKKRVLPAWMTAAVAPISSSSPKVQSSVKRSKAPKLTTPTVAHSPEEAGLSEEGEEHPRKRRRKDVATVRHQRGSSSTETSGESDSVAMEVGEEGKGGETSTAVTTATTQAPDVTESKEEDRKSKEEQGTKRSSSVSARLRTPCPFGKDCYRKNPVHFQECSHPGDSDFEEEEEENEEEVDRPECPYGTDCYRKNPLHRKEYKHTKRAARSQTVPMKSPVDDEDEDEYDDSFIDDDSEDVGQDSDYIPPDSDDSSKEDVRLQKEAQVFLKRRK
ncbi:aprataxin and PNK-like factor isoform X2 [Hippoglossus stenolepis]|uniref:aprataxin and PNK-like factor isoform X2 n=1 Tax=Hippoglossus stenolepis TaxID=195615 RepID=UPI00159BF662|nr:aprataxin and PNK-like factor isoform X2 [Hippoglossus stenolepis]